MLPPDDVTRRLPREPAVLAARAAVGVVFVAHGAQKLFTPGLSGTTDAYTGMDVPAPPASALFAALAGLVSASGASSSS